MSTDAVRDPRKDPRPGDVLGNEKLTFEVTSNNGKIVEYTLRNKAKVAPIYAIPMECKTKLKNFAVEFESMEIINVAQS